MQPGRREHLENHEDELTLLLESSSSHGRHHGSKRQSDSSDKVDRNVEVKFAPGERFFSTRPSYSDARKDFRSSSSEVMAITKDVRRDRSSGKGRVGYGYPAAFMNPDIGETRNSCSEVSTETKPILVKAKPLSPSIARKLPRDYAPKDFVKSQDGLPLTSAGGSGGSMSSQKDTLNKLSAQLLRAEIMGNAALVQKLKADIEHYKSKIDEKASGWPQATGGGDEVALVKFDTRKGTALPATAIDECEGSSVQELFRKEKMMSAAEDFEVYERVPKMAFSKVHEDWTVDDAISSRKRKLTPEVEKNRRKQALIRDHERSEQTLSKCRHCYGSSWMNKHLMIAAGLQTYLALPNCKPLVDGHCCIMPRDHISSCVQMDEDVFEEMKMWRKSLVAMFHASGRECIFMESARNVRHMPHARVECFPVSPNVAANAPAFFKKAIMECDEEWADNKRLIDLSQRDIRKSIPRGFSYFVVDFGLRGGFAHVVENEELVSTWFGQEVLGGMLGLDYGAWRNPAPEGFEAQSLRTRQFKSQWAAYDWTETAKCHLSKSL
uniref:Cwf19-like C-terminal domain-containing protein n=1 Tax=Trichuris muris TaxID=70415 RepID=A0A5S6QIH4_TRIMR